MGKKSFSKPTSSEANLSSFLLAQGEGSKDNELDAVFANSKGPSSCITAPSLIPVEKNKDKRHKSSKGKDQQRTPVKEAPGSETVEEEVDDEILEPLEIDSDASLEMPSSDDDQDDDENDDGVEQAYAAKLAARRIKEVRSKNKKRKVEAERFDKQDSEASDEEEDDDEEEEEEDDDDDEEEEDEEMIDADDLTPGTILATKQSKSTTSEDTTTSKKKPSSKDKRLERDDTPEQRDARTVFLGNVPATCATSRPMKKALIRHVLQSPTLLQLLPADFPALKCDSIRFRSIAFASTVFGRKESQTNDPDAPDANPEGSRNRKRAREWRDSEGSDQRGVRGGFHAKEPVPSSSSNRGSSGALTDGQKRRVALFRGDLNQGKSTCNAYLVLEPFKNTPSSSLSDADLIKLIVQSVDATHFEGYTLRADIVRPRSTAALVAAAQIAAKPDLSVALPANAPKGPVYVVPNAEARRTVFIGGLDFGETEENVRKAIEPVLVREKGKASGRKGWVEGVRLIRDASSGLGKGFGYVLLQDPSCVDELLALPPGKFLKVSKRKVRLERCKTGIAAARAKASALVKNVSSLSNPSKTPMQKMGGGGGGQVLGAPRDPSLRFGNRPIISSSKLASQAALIEKQAVQATQLASLPPSDRKKIKALDPDRLARRAEKKKQKVLSERYERKMANLEKSGTGILGRESRGELRRRKEKKRVKEGNRTGKRAKKADL
ncbi:BZ3500_MvSof-1268-A1-R1_Chr6-3g09006 [Microbotryum saponariae]|uniref:Nucleolar protein 12 n=1 Tax=Microbotryum saponariae TaxID=289078 RepID=A0A2X0KK88_9BASI|nr:BZ3500_MvSof-1268-A1-R1_Chr6-3g09006 [Microbotryum saponariae]SDA07608.1 BZ3501_MvSof-1269-A2-R1_Chr6-2g08710 [Microbotryum saponariae]